MQPNHEDEMMNFFKAFVQVDRLIIAGLLGQKALTLEEIASQLQMRAPTIANHLGYLVHAGYVVQDGKRYRLNSAFLESLAKRVLAELRPKVRVEELEGEAHERKVLSDFLLPDGRLKGLPNQQKKLLVILNHVARSFQPGISYSERQVNEILARFYEDTASLRRYLVDYGHLQREKGIYWKPEAKSANAEV